MVVNVSGSENQNDGISDRWHSRPWRIILAVVTIVVALAVAYLAIMLVAATDVRIGPVVIEFKVEPSWEGRSIIELPPVGALEAGTHRTPTKLTYTLNEIAVSQAEELTREDSPARDDLRNWREPVEQKIRMLLLRIIIAAAVTAGAIAWLIQRRWRWAAIGAGCGMTLALMLAWLTWSSYDASAFAEPDYTGNLSQAREIVDFSQDVVANLDAYGDQVPAIAANLFRTINEMQQLPSELPVAESLRVLHVSDLHGSAAGAELLRDVAQQYAVEFVIDTGDITELGTPFELDYPGSYLPLDVPYVWISGNHDNRLVVQAMENIDGVIVLKNQITEISGIRVAGFPDPTSASLIPRVATQSELEENSKLVLELIDGNPPPPEIAAVHDSGQARLLPGVVPVILSGHIHRHSIDIDDGSVLVNAGSTGAGGYRGYENVAETPNSLQVLYFDTITLQLVAVDTILIHGFSQEFQISRRVFSE